jgi:hypothetical protein
VLIFVSYSRQDHDLDTLRRIEKRIAGIGQPYIDDLYDHQARNRLVTVYRALHAAHSFVLVHSPNYLKTAWTRMEYRFAVMTESPLIALTADGTLIEESVVEAAKPPGPTEVDAVRFRHHAGLSACKVQSVRGDLHSGNGHARLVSRGVQHDADLELCEHFPPPRVIGGLPFLGYGAAGGH